MKRILMIDPSIIELAGIHLKDIHCELTEASNGFEGLHLASTNSYDAIILDIMLPDINGIEICKRLRAELYSIIMLTARSGK
jgi:DNA-binding response OmpR family regulator